jgi:cell division protein FtsZ
MGFEIVDSVENAIGAVIKVVGVGSGGVNAVNTMIENEITGVQYIAVNTDAQHLSQSRADIRLALSGPTQGHGTGGDPVKGRDAAMQERKAIEEILRGAHMVVLPTGLGGGTGTGATPVIGEIARSMGILTVAVATMPFSWDGRVKNDRAWAGLEELKSHVDAFVTIPNDKMLKMSKGVPSRNAFQRFDQILCDAVAGVVELVTRPGYINRDFEDVKSVLENCGQCVIGTGIGEGSNRAENAVHMALCNPLMEDTPVEGARSILINIIQGPSGTLEEAGIIMERVRECLDENGNISFGLAEDDRLGEKVKVTIIASGMDDIESIREPLPIVSQDEDFMSGSRPMPFADSAPVSQFNVRTRRFGSVMENLGFGARANPNEMNTNDNGSMIFSSVGGSEFESQSYSKCTPENSFRTSGYNGGSSKIDGR